MILRTVLMCGLSAVYGGSTARANDVVVHAGTLLDGIGEAPRHEVSILVRDHKILAVGAGYVSPPGAEIVDLSGSTVMPGFIVPTLTVYTVASGD